MDIKELCSRLREERLKRNLTIAQASDYGDDLFISPASITNVEYCNHIPNIQTLQILARKYGYKVEFNLVPVEEKE